MRNKTIFSAIAALTLLGASGFLIFKQRESKIELGPYQALGAVAAEETIKLMGEKGQIVVVAQDTSTFEMPALEAQLKAFRTTARKKAAVTVVLEKITLDAMMMMTGGGRAPAGPFLKILQNYPKASAIVLFFGFPLLENRDLDALQKRAAKMIVAAAYRPDYPKLFERRVLDLAIVPRFDALPETTKRPQTLREWFEQEYVIITPDKAAALVR